MDIDIAFVLIPIFLIVLILLVPDEEMITWLKEEKFHGTTEDLLLSYDDNSNNSICNDGSINIVPWLLEEEMTDNLLISDDNIIESPLYANVPGNIFYIDDDHDFINNHDASRSIDDDWYL